MSEPTDSTEGVRESACTCGTCPVHGGRGTILVLPDDGVDRSGLLRLLSKLDNTGALIGDPGIQRPFPDGGELAKLLKDAAPKAPTNRAQRRGAAAQARKKR